MTKEVLVNISGLQFAAESGKDTVEMITAAEYYQRNGAHYILYEEIMEGETEPTKNMVKIRDNVMEVTKKGISNVHMVFEEGKKNETYYFTPFGSLLLGIDARQIKMEEQEDMMDIQVEYGLELNHEHLADCVIKINVKSKDNKDFSLQ